MPASPRGPGRQESMTAVTAAAWVGLRVGGQRRCPQAPAGNSAKPGGARSSWNTQPFARRWVRAFRGTARSVLSSLPIPCKSAAFDRAVRLVRCAGGGLRAACARRPLPGRIVVQHRDGYLVATDEGELRAKAAGRLLHEAEEAGQPAVGDWVALSPNPARRPPPSMPSCRAAPPSSAGRPTACRGCRSSPPISTSPSSSPR